MKCVEAPSTRPAVRVKPRVKVREAAHVLTARSKQARAARAAARNKQGQSSQEHNDVGISAASSVESPSEAPVKVESGSLPSSPVGGADAPAAGCPVSVTPSYAVPAVLDRGRSSNEAPADLPFSQGSLPAAVHNGRPLAKQHRSSTAHPALAYHQSLPMQNSPVASVATANGEAARVSSSSILPQLQLPTPQPARGAAAVPITLPGSDPLPQTEFSPPIGGPVFHAGMAQRHPTITTRYRAKRSSETPKSSPVAYIGTAGSGAANHRGSPLRPFPRTSNSLATAAPAPNQPPLSNLMAESRLNPGSQPPGSQVSQWAPPLPQQSPFGVARYAVPAVSVPGPADSTVASSATGPMHTPGGAIPPTGIGGPMPCKAPNSHPASMEQATAADCAAQLRAAALAQYILSTAPTLMPTVFGHMSADAVAQALPALASASGLLASSMSRPSDSTEGGNAAELLTQVKKRYPSLQIPSDLVTSARNDTQQARYESLITGM